MSEPVCHLEEFFMTRVNCAWHDPKESTTVEVGHTFDYDVHRSRERKNLFRLVFRFGLVSLTPVPMGYELDSEIIGYFSFPEDTPEKNMQELIRYNGCTILYGILRGQIAGITGSFPHDKLVLPTVMMENVVREIETRKTREAKTSAVAKKPVKKAAKRGKPATKK